MAVFIVITFFIVRFKPVYVLIICVIIGCLAGYYAFDGDFLVNRRILVFYPFFYMGYLLNPDKIEAFTRKKVMRIGALISCLILSVFLWKNIERLYRFLPFFDWEKSAFTVRESGTLRRTVKSRILCGRFGINIIVDCLNTFDLWDDFQMGKQYSGGICVSPAVNIFYLRLPGRENINQRF